MNQSSFPNRSRAGWPSQEPHFTLFHWNEAIWQAVLETCAAAKDSIDLEQYILGHQGIGRDLLDLLAERARNGVKVRVLADGLGSRGLTSSDAGRTLLQSGGQIVLHHPVPGAQNPFRRLHRKTLVCDSDRVMLGGACYKERMSGWRDTMIRLDGPPPPALSETFEQAWRSAQHGARSSCLGNSVEQSERGWQFGATGPAAPGVPDLGCILRAQISEAKRSVTLSTPYLLPDRRLRDALTTAVARGVSVRILMPAKSDHPALDVLGRRMAAWLSRDGISVYGYRPAMLHAKLALVDDAWAMVSSYNLDLFSARLNLEAGVMSSSPRLIGELAGQLDADFHDSEPMRPTI